MKDSFPDTNVILDKHNFWSKYDMVADKHDKVMLRRLDGDLDVLLIFVSALIALYKD